MLSNSINYTDLPKASFTRYGAIKPDSNDFNIRDGLLEADEALFCNEGLLSDPTITDATGVAVKITSVDVLMHSDSTWGGKLYHKTVPTNTALALTDNSINYIYVDWNDGNPIYAATTDRDTINNSNAIPVSRIYMSSGDIEYQLDYDFIARGATIRNLDRVMRIRGVYGMERESGLAITETATRVVNIAAGYAWFGLSRKTLAAIAQGGAGVVSELWYHSSGAWTKTTITAYNNTQYDNGTNLATLTSNRYAVNWIFRNITSSEIDIVLGTGDYTLAQAEASLVPTLPTAISNFYILCGRIIVQKSSNTAYAIETVSSSAFAQAAVSTHSDLGGLTTGDDHTQYFYSAGDTSDQKLYSGADLIVYSDAGSTEVARIDGATGNITTSGTVDTMDLLAHAHTGTTGGTQLDWDTCWADAVHSHASDAEGGALTTTLLDDTAGGTDSLLTKAPTSNVMYDHGVATTGVHGAGANTILNTGDVDDTPVDNATTAPVSSNWAYDHVAAADPHTVYPLDTEVLKKDGSVALTADWNIGEQAIDLDETLSADGKYSGITCAGVAGATVAFGDLIYLSETDQRWELTDATTTATSTGQLGICLSAGTDGTAINVLLYGYVCETSWDWNEYVVDKRLYISETAGDMSQYVPLTDAAVVRIVGYVHDDGDTIFFDPAKDWYEINVVDGAGASTDIGATASDRASNCVGNYTVLNVSNPCNADGIIDTVELWFATDATGVIVGTFYGSGTSWTARDWYTIGAVTSGSKQTFPGLSIQCRVNDIIGVYPATGGLERSTAGGGGFLQVAGNKFGVGATTYTLYANIDLSAYGSGITKTNTIVSINGMDIA